VGGASKVFLRYFEIKFKWSSWFSVKKGDSEERLRWFGRIFVQLWAFHIYVDKF
jgi:hypothetical protein